MAVVGPDHFANYVKVLSRPCLDRKNNKPKAHTRSVFDLNEDRGLITSRVDEATNYVDIYVF